MVKQHEHTVINIAKTVLSLSLNVFILFKAPLCKHGSCAEFALQGMWVQKEPKDWEKEQMKDAKKLQYVTR